MRYNKRAAATAAMVPRWTACTKKTKMQPTTHTKLVTILEIVERILRILILTVTLLR